MDKIDTELQNNFQSSVNPHDAHVQAWTGQLDPMHPLALIDRIRQAERESFGNAWDYWQEVDKPTPTNQTEPPPAPTTAAPAPAQTPAPVVAASSFVVVEVASDGPAPLTRNEIANCFAELRDWDVARWKSELSSPDDWLKACQQRKGTRGRGGYESTWWPVCIATAMVERNDTTAKLVSARFKTMEPLKRWRDAWENNYPETI